MCFVLSDVLLSVLFFICIEKILESEIIVILLPKDLMSEFYSLAIIKIEV